MPVSGDRVKQTAEAEHIGPDYTGDNISAKKVAGYVWNGSAWERTGVGFSAVANVNTEITIAGSVKTIVQTDGTKTCTITIDSTDPNDKTITKVWS